MGLATYNVSMRTPEFYDHQYKLDDGVLIPLILNFWHIIYNMVKHIRADSKTIEYPMSL